MYSFEEYIHVLYNYIHPNYFRPFSTNKNTFTTNKNTFTTKKVNYGILVSCIIDFAVFGTSVLALFRADLDQARISKTSAPMSLATILLLSNKFMSV